MIARAVIAAIILWPSIALAGVRADVSATVNGRVELHGTIDYERPRRLRLVLSSVIGREIEIGSNDTTFWFWCRRFRPEVCWINRHGQPTRLRPCYTPQSILPVVDSLPPTVTVTDGGNTLVLRLSHWRTVSVDPRPPTMAWQSMER